MVDVIGRWPESRSSPILNSAPVDQVLLIAVMSAVLRPPVPLLINVVVPSLGVLALWERNQSSTKCVTLICR